MDETPLFMNIASTKTIAKVGSKEVVIRPTDKKKWISLQYYVLLLMVLNYPNVGLERTVWRKSRKENKKHLLIQSQKIFAYTKEKLGILKQ